MIKKYTAIVVEDEYLPRMSLLQKLKDYHPEIQVLADCEDAETAIEMILKLRPEILFLDIQLSGQNSIWLLEQLQDTSVNPYIIFTTAYNEPEYLLKAIKLDAVAYLLKPVNIQELAQAVKKVEDKINHINVDTGHCTVSTFKTLNSILVLKQDEILYCEADGNYCQLYLENGTVEIIFERLGELEKRLLNTSIIRAGKSFLININYVYKIDNKHNICMLKSTKEKLYNIKLSPSGIEAIKHRID
ncbi:LytTR family DNA-binding domain-containing protein [Odoribacter sp. OttesenSCG-928-L07]|nr:LytTR family DNA-binding domain-containing protein [Odoribacter sp. OttesenSCG-928-L07]MDL2238998.1 LytTR family DNA-binding domain-containing protein [Bacteroidales bacterium OttesenSCG-928-L14]MDL2240714.1 LytTR family DNA-binding domain-containing protein [Bacteroidales bacterium OttesenSCG-928-K22]